MEVIKLIKDIKDGFKLSGIIKDDNIFVLKDIDKDINKFRNHKQGYNAFISVVSAGFDYSGKDGIDIAVGVSGVSSTDDDDYLQVMAKCLYILKNALYNSSYIKDEDVNDMSVTVSSEERNDSVLTYTYGDLSFELKYANGAN